MKSGEHFLLSIPVVGWVLTRTDGRSPRRLAALAAYGLGLGVLIDLDHFVLARLRVGDWHHLTDCLRDPKRVFVDQENLFEGTGEMASLRLLSHVLIGGALIALARRVSRPAERLTESVFFVHVLADLLRDNEIV
ncbi:hypothetical protein C448_13776 [Halococcus morrhuae DSM 1307]|uniref:Membrane-bound metal-dependent hydrolase n=1 Tax=Halococcus morrhuae DSM 1307 TaxID=931277 RepID=M0M3N3_HALMO|nr:hypothetical protein [Halococcus morrhuae]EMA40422.1 hypothetical protein C448_13776 [Halococcus morrhuae DSM 1307]